LWELTLSKNPRLTRDEAVKTILFRLVSIEQRRPLASLSNKEKEQADKIRRWYKTKFIRIASHKMSLSDDMTQQSEYE